MEQPTFWMSGKKVPNSLKEIPPIDTTIMSWDNVDRNIPVRFTIVTGITWSDGAVLPIVWDQKDDQEYSEIDSTPWNGPHSILCEGEKTPQNIVDCICIKSYCHTLLKTISDAVLNSENRTLKSV